MEEFVREAFRVERDLVRLAYWISALEWGHYSPYAESLAMECQGILNQAIPKLMSLRHEAQRRQE